MKIQHVLFWLLACTNLLLAAEGFYEDIEKLPHPVRHWLGRTFMVYSTHQSIPIGTVVLIHNENQEAYFIGNRHVLSRCKPLSICRILRGAEWHPLDKNLLPKSEIELEIEELGIFQPKHKSWLSSELADDLGYIKTISDPRLPIVSLADIGRSFREPLDRKKEVKKKHFILGYPNLTTRGSLKNEANAQAIKLRISGGEVVLSHPLNRYLNKEKTQFLLPMRFHYRTDADSLAGNSGSPVLDESGHLLGILQGGLVDEFKPYPAFYSWIVPLDSVKLMIGEVLLGKIPKLKHCQDLPSKVIPIR